MRIALDQFCEIENGAVRSVDVSKLSHLQKAERPADSLRLIRTQARPADAMAQLQRLLVLARPENMALVPRDQFALARLPEFSSTGVPSQTRPADTGLRLQPLQRQTYNYVQDGNGPVELELPLGTPRYLNVRTLKELLGARPQDRFLRKIGQQWEICPDSYRVDRLAQTEIFLLGNVQIYS